MLNDGFGASGTDRTRVADLPYASGEYFSDPQRHSEDAALKANAIVRLLDRQRASDPRFTIQSYADVGCGSGKGTKLVTDQLRQRWSVEKAKGFDISPHVGTVRHDGVEYEHADFRHGAESFDLVTLFDVFEHVPDPIAFIRAIAARAVYVGFHIPLDANLNCLLRDLMRVKLHDPGHLIFLEASGALNMLAMAGLRVVDYEYTWPDYVGSSNSRANRLARPIRRVLARISPWLLSLTLGGASLAVLAATPTATKRSG